LDVVGMAINSENIFKFLLENSSDPVILFDIGKLQITGLNNSAAEFLSGSSEKDMQKIFHEELIGHISSRKTTDQYQQILQDSPLSGGKVSFSSVGKNGILIINNDFNIWCRHILTGMKFPVAFFNTEGKLIYWNEKAVKLFSYPAESLYRKHAVDIIDILTEMKTDNRNLKAFREGINKFKTKSGKEIEVECSNSLIKDSGGKVSGILCLMKELVSETDQGKNKIQEELLLSESRFRMLFQQSPLIIQIFNSDGDLIKYNSCFAKTWNIDPDKIRSYNLYKDEQLMNGELSAYLERAKMGQFSEIEPIRFHPDYAKNYIWMRGFIYPVMSNSHNEIVLILENITDQKKIEESFGMEASYRNAIESSISAGIAVVDLQGKQTYVNDAFCRMVDWSKEELVGLYPPFPYWAEENMDDIKAALQETIQGHPSSQGYELKFRKKNNDCFDVLVIINPLKNAEGNTEGWLASVSDISRLKTVEKEIKHSLREKEVLLKEIHHRVKNNLQIISSLLNLQLNYINDKEMQNIFKESQNRVMSMALIHQKLIPFQKPSAH
jgi:PAS domain S-box-containing protein